MAIIKFSTKQSLFALLSLSALISPVTPTVPMASLADLKRRVKEVTKEVKSSLVGSDRRLNAFCDEVLALVKPALEQGNDMDFTCSCEQSGGTSAEPHMVTISCKTCHLCDSGPFSNHTDATCGTYMFKTDYNLLTRLDTHTDELQQTAPEEFTNKIVFTEKHRRFVECSEVTWHNTKCNSCAMKNVALSPNRWICLEYDCSNVVADLDNITICGDAAVDLVSIGDVSDGPPNGAVECKSGASTAAAATAFTGLMAAGILVFNMM